MMIQTIQTQWSKKSRGNPGATERNATPEILEFSVHKQKDSIVWHYSQYFEPDFELEEEIRHRESNYKQFHHVVIDAAKDVVDIELYGRHRFSLRKGEIGSIVYNYSERIVVDDWYDTVYHKICVNLANDVEFHGNVFMNGFNKVERELRNMT